MKPKKNIVHEGIQSEKYFYRAAWNAEAV